MRIERLTVKNYRVLADVTFRDLTPLTVLCGPNGSGKSTVFDVFAFLNDSFTEGLRPAWDRRNRQTHPRVRALRDFIQGWYLSYVSAAGTRTTPNAGPERRLTQSGDNLANVIQYLEESHPERLRQIFETLSARVPQLQNVLPTRLADGRLLLQLKDRPFAEPILSQFASDGTLKLLAYLTVLYDPEPFEVIGIEEPENQLHPRLLPVLAEEIREVSGASQVLVTTHSAEFLSTIRPNELWTINRADDGFARVARVSEDDHVMAMMDAGASLGWLWSAGYLPAGNPAGV